MVKKHHSCLRKLEGNIIVLDSYDGAQHTGRHKTNIVSYSSQIFSESTVRSGASPAESLNILTRQQVLGEEKAENLFPVVHSVFSMKQALYEGKETSPVANCQINYYDMHDGKMLYMLTQHSLYNRKHHPFLLCTCHCGDGVTNNKSHTCKLVQHSEQIRLYARSKKKWD